MKALDITIESILAKKNEAELHVHTLGYFQLFLQNQPISDSAWKRDTAIQLFQFFITIRNHRALHKDQIAYQLWNNAGTESANRNFKAALHNVLKVIEPNKPSRSPSEFIIRQGHTYRLNAEKIWIDLDTLEELIILGNHLYKDDKNTAIQAYKHATDLYLGQFLPNRIYEDWAADERERIQVLALGAMMTLAKLMLDITPKESIRLAKLALSIDNSWEEAYRIQMEAYMLEGNRPMAVKAYQQCHQILLKEFDFPPLPETTALFEKIRK